MATTPDAAAIRLRDALRRHRGDTQAYRRLGEQLAARRLLLARRYGNRALFVRERGEPLGLNAKYIFDLESAGGWGRKGFSAGKMLAVAEAYNISADDISAVLDGGELEAANVSPLQRPRPSADEPPWLPPLSPDRLDEATPYADQIYATLLDLAAQGITSPTGGQVFPSAPEDAATWDVRADLMTAAERVWLIAALRLRQASGRARDTSAG